MAGRKKDSKQKSHRIKISVSTVVLIAALAVFCFAGVRLLMILRNYQSSNDEYKKISESYTQQPDSDEAGDADESESAGGDPVEDADPPLSVDWAQLKEINPDIVGWIYVDGENTINYPVLKAADNEYYLHRTFQKETRYAGSIFMDYHNNADFSDPDTIIYGHNMRNGSMFGTLKYLYDQETYDADPYFWILTPNGDYRYHIFAIFQTDVDSAVYTLFSKNGPEFLAWEQNLQAASGVTNSVPLTEEDKTVILSTCTSDSSKRTVVIGKCVSTRKP